MDLARAFFFLMGEKGYSVLQHFIKVFGAESVEGVVTAQDPGVNPDYYDQVIALCREHSIAVYERRDRVNPTVEYSFAIGWRWLIDSGKSTLIVLHDSLLPRYRGFNPLVSCLINGEPEIGVTAFFASAEYDRGPVIGQARRAISHPISIQSAISTIALLYAELVCEIFTTITKGQHPIAHPQDESNATYSLWRDEEDYHIDWTQEAQYLQRFVLAVGPPYAGAKTIMGEDCVRIFETESLPDVFIENRMPGKVIVIDQGRPVVVCGKGLLLIKRAVRESDGTSIIPMTRIRTRLK